MCPLQFLTSSMSYCPLGLVAASTEHLELSLQTRPAWKASHRTHHTLYLSNTDDLLFHSLVYAGSITLFNTTKLIYRDICKIEEQMWYRLTYAAQSTISQYKCSSFQLPFPTILYRAEYLYSSTQQWCYPDSSHC